MTAERRLGLAIAQYGPHATADAVHTVAAAAEEIGFDSLWVGDRLLRPVEPTELYGGLLPWPEGFGTFLDPLVTLTAAAARTERIRLGTNVLIAPLHVPVRLARELASLDVLSGGRLMVGLGVGWSRQEYAAAGVPWAERGARLEETLDVLEAVWAGSPVSHQGHFWHIDPARIDPRPPRRPPLYLAGRAPAALDRVARRADGWLPAGVPFPVMAETWERLRAKNGSLELIVRGNVFLTGDAVSVARGGTPGERFPFVGSRDQVVEDVLTCFRLGAHEVLLDLQQTCDDPRRMLAEAALIHERVRCASIGG
ncbi:TIGR03619 family F420-dependent LLM class oxidoreductase [Spirillospora sp. NPDC047279]|uniref:TIGR03619 family F420-dependent LLM class oxidoreductase n=1 Tax=Spirillospora sp. NPDC047279 TaxID=3155478 RepID=UPI0033ED6120